MLISILSERYYCDEQTAEESEKSLHNQMILSFRKDKHIFSHKHLHPIDFKYAGIAKRAYFVGIEEFHAARAFVEIVAEGDAAVPELDFTRACPKADVDWVG